MGGNEELNIVVKLQDEASAKLTELQGKFSQMQASLAPAIDASQKFAAGLLAVGTAVGTLGYSMLKSAADAEQTQVAFSTMLGSADKALQFTKDLTAFAAATPFELKGLEQSSKQLLAYGVAQKDVIPDLTTLGNIAAGVGMDKMPNLIMAFGQVKAATHLTGMELRQFTEAGVPLLQALVDQMNATGGAMTTVGATSKKTAKEITSTTAETSKYTAQLAAANDQLTKQNNRLADMQKTHKTTSASYKNLQIDIENTKDKIKDLTGKIGSNNTKLGQLGPITAGVSKQMKYTVADIQKMVSAGTIGFDQVQKALAGMSGEGGVFQDLMEKQSHTLGGMVSNLQDAWESFLRGEGKLFIEWAKEAVGWLTVFIKTTLPAWIEKVQEATQWLGEHKTVLAALVGVIAGGLTLAVWALVAAFAALALELAPFAIAGGALFAFVEAIREGNVGVALIAGGILTLFIPSLISLATTLYSTLVPAFIALGVAMAPFLVTGIIIAGLVAGIAFLILHWDTLVEHSKQICELVALYWNNMWTSFKETVNSVWQGIKDSISSSVNWVIDKVNSMISAINSASAAAAGLFGGSGKSVALPNIPKFADGGVVTGPTVGLIGEAGPEAVIPLSKMGNMGGTTVIINNPEFRSRDDEDRLKRMLDQYFRPMMMNNKI